VFQQLDAPQSVSEEGMTAFLAGVPYEMQQKRREQLLDVKAEDVKMVAEKFLIKGAEGAATTVLGARKDWVKEADGWMVKDLGMVGERVEELQDDAQPVVAAAAAAAA
jgi:Zn-dependent M16 (insulinase) family peptidase